MQNLDLPFDWHYIGQKEGRDFAKFCGLRRLYELYMSAQENFLNKLFRVLSLTTIGGPCTEGDSIREGLWHQKFTKMATSNSLSFMVLFMCKKHVIKNKINI